jgi:hypothetical protein
MSLMLSNIEIRIAKSEAGKATEKIGRMIMNQLLREKVIKRPRSIQDLMSIFKTFWKNTFFDGLYINDPITYDGNTARWFGSKCYVYEAVKKADMLDTYACGCQSLRDGAMKALRLKPLHEIRESLVKGDGRCVIEITFAPDRS